MTSKHNVMTERAGKRKVIGYSATNGMKLLYSTDQVLNHSSSKSIANRPLKHAGEELFKIYGVKSKREFMMKDDAKAAAKQKMRLSMCSGDEPVNFAEDEKARLSLPIINKNQ